MFNNYLFAILCYPEYRSYSGLLDPLPIYVIGMLTTANSKEI